MEHPLVGKLDSFTADQLLDTINDLNKKLGIAYNTGNHHLCNQIRMAIDSYQTEYQKKLRGNGGTPFDSVIDIK
jgi:hypothetical protein